MKRSERLHRIVVELNRVADMIVFYDTDRETGTELYGLFGIIDSLIQVVAQRRDEIKTLEEQVEAAEQEAQR